jgi:hypothetical protein
MNSLREVQDGFLRAVTGADDRICALIRADGLDSARRVQIYRNNMTASLTEALRAVYPAIDRLVGHEFFDFAAREYMGRHPSRSGNLHGFGHAFGRFLAGFEPAAGLPYLPDVAALEWGYHEVFHAADVAPLDLERLARVDPADYGRLRFVLTPSCRLLASAYPVVRIWHVNQDGFDGDPTVDLDEGGVHVLIIRPGLDIELHTLDRGDFVLLAALREGKTFEAACEAALNADPAIALDSALPRYASLNALTAFELAG